MRFRPTKICPTTPYSDIQNTPQLDRLTLSNNLIETSKILPFHFIPDISYIIDRPS